jgi:hypothetical protein
MASVKDRYNDIQKYKKEMDDIFYGHGLLMKNFKTFYDAVNKADHDIPYAIAKDYYNNQAVVQIFKPLKPTKNHYKIISLVPFERIYCDSMYLTMKNSVLGMINIIDLFSKYAFSKCFILPKGTSAMGSDKAVIAFNEFLSEVKHFDIPIGIVYTDRGGEFLGNFMKHLENKNIVHVYANAGDKRKTAPIERFNGTLRLMIEKWKVVYAKVDPRAIQIMVDSYNKVPHAGLKYSPIEILNDKSIQDKITANYMIIQKENKPIVQDDGILVGMYVRVLIKKGSFKKISPIWSNQVYRIASFNNGNYKLDGIDGNYKRDELQVVENKLLMNRKVKIAGGDVDSDVVSDKSTVVPANNTIRTRGKVVDYKLLAKGK